MTAEPETKSSSLPTARRHDYIAVLLVTAAARETVRAKLDRVAQATEPDRLYRIQHYRVAPLRAAPQDEVAEQLGAREREVLKLVADGLSDPAIARALCVSTETTKAHITNTLRKLGSHDRANGSTSHISARSSTAPSDGRQGVCRDAPPRSRARGAPTSTARRTLRSILGLRRCLCADLQGVRRDKPADAFYVVRKPARLVSRGLPHRMTAATQPFPMRLWQCMNSVATSLFSGFAATKEHEQGLLLECPRE
ncbi:LuxR C-terminal-related transcriptional regulator [Amycolatopsis sp. NPDC050768]|uniref:helix-turn-helix transcriptional regulator n=1 Tax=Amycolatopsis sp. NPDC050768 TaxID=3154839 RepID=UPI003403E486